MENKIEVVASGNEIVVREGKAHNVYDPEKVFIFGQITSPRYFYESRKFDEKYFPKTSTYVLVDRNSGEITLRCNETDRFGATIVGKLVQSVEAETLGINENRAWSPLELAKKLQLMRHILPDREEAMALISELKSFKADINTNVENTKEDRGNRRNLLEVSLSTNVPRSFTVQLAVFKGQKPVNITVEILLEVQAGIKVDCYLQSPELLQLASETRDSIFNTELEVFLKDGITVIEL